MNTKQFNGGQFNDSGDGISPAALLRFYDTVIIDATPIAKVGIKVCTAVVTAAPITTITNTNDKVRSPW